MNETKDKRFSVKMHFLFGRIEFKFFIFIFYLLLLSWPFISTATGRTFLFYFIYYFSIWIALVIHLILSRAGEDIENNND